MKILFIVGQVYPTSGSNTQLIGKLLGPVSRDHEVRLLSLTAPAPKDRKDEFYGVPVYYLRDGAAGTGLSRTLIAAASKLLDPSGNSDYVLFRYARKRLSEIGKEFPFQWIAAVSEPFPAGLLAAFSKARSALYLMDPPERICGGSATRYRDRMLPRMLRRLDVLITTPFIHRGLERETLLKAARCAVREVGFPMVTQPRAIRPKRRDPQKTALLFTGWMCVSIRSPQYFLDLLSRLDERFTVTFMGRECEKLTERFEINTKAELIILPQQPYETALQAMADADVLINIGNSVPVHMPSKTLEYINTGKPIVNFYKLDDCPTLYYTKRYPLCLDLSEQDPDLDAAAARFREFCAQNKGKTVDRAYIEAEYADCTPEYIAQIILDTLGE